MTPNIPPLLNRGKQKKSNIVLNTVALVLAPRTCWREWIPHIRGDSAWESTEVQDFPAVDTNRIAPLSFQHPMKEDALFEVRQKNFRKWRKAMEASRWTQPLHGFLLGINNSFSQGSRLWTDVRNSCELWPSWRGRTRHRLNWVLFK